MSLVNIALRHGYQLVFRSRRVLRQEVAKFVAPLRGDRVLELGSGKPVKGLYPYSCADLIDDSNEVLMSDLDPAFGHEVVDVTTMKFEARFDAILCCNVLEHIYDFSAATQRIRQALRPGGRVFISVPVFFPLHDEPHDYWRFTEHSLRRLLSDFDDVRIRHQGIRRAPIAYFVVAMRAADKPGRTAGDT